MLEYLATMETADDRTRFEALYLGLPGASCTMWPITS